MTRPGRIEQLRDALARVAERGHFLSSTTVEEALTERDTPLFDDAWVRVHQMVETARAGGDVPAEVNQLREEAFSATYEAYQESDLAACVSDDFELIVEADRLGVHDDWLDALWERYAAGRFPCGTLL